MAEPAAYLLVALSGRALALAARRSGRRAVVLDLFGDADMRASVVASLVVAGGLDQGFDPAALTAAADRLAPPAAPAAYGFVYGAGLEGRPDLIAALARGRRLYGNSARSVGLAKDPRSFFTLLDRLGFPHPAIAFERPDDAENWLAKRVGASGGSHVVPAGRVRGTVPGLYYQRRAPGRPVGASFLADGRRALLLGFSEQWTWTRGGGASFRFGGALQPGMVPPRVAQAATALLDALVPELGLVGLNSLDMMVEGERFAVIEVNPRPGANLDIFDGTGGPGLFELHLRACEGELPGRWTPPARATAMAVVYGVAPARVPEDAAWPDWVVDRPAPGVAVVPGAPVCTVLAEASTAAEVRALAEARVAEVLARLRPQGRPEQGPGADDIALRPAS